MVFTECIIRVWVAEATVVVEQEEIYAKNIK
jgi:hypothetical protein